jgi:hypothetical protein
MNMRIVFEPVPCTRLHCWVCDGNTEKNAVCAVARNDDGTEIGYICEQCIAAGSEGMRQRAFVASVQAQRWAAEKVKQVMELQEEQFVCPTIEQWHAAEREFEEKLYGKPPETPSPAELDTAGVPFC